MITKPHYKFIMDITQIIYRNIQILLFSKPYASIPFPVSIGLNLSGRGTLITSVLQTLPLYTFSCFKVLETICKRLDAIIAALAATNDGRDLPTEGGQNKRKRQPA